MDSSRTWLSRINREIVSFNPTLHNVDIGLHADFIFKKIAFFYGIVNIKCQILSTYRIPYIDINIITTTMITVIFIIK